MAKPPLRSLRWPLFNNVIVPRHRLCRHALCLAGQSQSRAATNIQDAADPGDTVLVTNGVYATGGRAVGTNLLLNRVAVDKPLNLLSVNGPEVTIIQGYQVPGTTNGDGAIRCVSLTNGASLSGFTLTKGATRGSGDFSSDRSGGGLFCESTNAAVTNCIVSGNSAGVYGGGAYFCALNECTLTGNSAQGGGGAAVGTLNHCTRIRNSASSGGRAWDGTLKNCIFYHNSAANGPNYVGSNINYSCTTPLPVGGIGNIDLDPLFIDTNGWSNLRLQSNSPCSNAGNNAYVTSPTDLDGNPRIVSGTVDIGAYEYQGAGSVISYAWLQHYGLPTAGSTDTLATDLEGHNAGQEWKAWTDPTNALSVLKLFRGTFAASYSTSA